MAGLIIIVVIGALFALWANAIAKGKHRNAGAWATAAFFTGIIAIVVLLTLPKVEAD